MSVEDSKTKTYVKIEGGINGESRKRWLDNLLSDFGILDIVDWKTKYRNRKNWTTIMREVKVHSSEV